MAIPTIASVDPTSGPSMGGNLVFLTGTNYLLPVPVSPPGGITLPLVPSIQVTAGGVDVPFESIVAASTVRLGFIAPKHTLSGSEALALADIVVTNLDGNGDPIAGETVTLVGGYTYQRPDLSHQNEGELVLLVRALLGRLRSDIVPNVAHTSHPDYDSDPSTVYIDQATLPALLLMGPAAERDGLYEQTQACELADQPQVGEVFERRGGRSQALTFDILGIAGKSVISLNMQSAFVNWVERNTEITYTRVTGGQLTVDLDFVEGADPQALRRTRDDMNDGLFKWEAQILIRGFQENSLPGLALDQAVGITGEIADDGVTLLQPLLQLTDNVGSRAPVSHGK